VSASIRIFYYTGPYTGTLLPQADGLVARLSAARRARLAKRAAESQRALELVALRLLELGMEASGHGAFRVADVEYPEANGISGKPLWAGAGVDFSISHANSMAMVAIAQDGRVGVDVELARPIEVRIVRRLLREDAAIGAELGEHNALQRWTQIEAILKGAGIGVMHGREIDWRADGIRLRDVRWHLHRIDCGPDHIAHVATDQPDANVKIYKIDLL